MRWLIATALLVACPCAAGAQWKVEQGAKLSTFGERTGVIAKLAAKAPVQGVTGMLHIECFTHPELQVLTLSLITSKGTAPGYIGYRYQFDQLPSVTRSPSPRLSLLYTGLGDSGKDELAGLPKAKKMRVTLMPLTGPQWTFDFDVAGAADAIKAIPCKEKRPR